MGQQRSRKTTDEKLQDLSKKLEQLTAQKKALELRANKEYRAKRTRRLIQNGALSEKYFNRPDIDPEDFEKLLLHLVNIDQVKEVLRENK